MLSPVGTISTTALEHLSQYFGDRLKLRLHQRILYGYDATGISATPDAVVHVSSLDDARFLVRVAHASRVPLVARGAGTGLSAGSVPEVGGIVVSFESMRQITSIDVKRLRVWVEPGVINRSLDGVLAPYQVFYPPDPASHRVSTLGGNIAENSGGPHAVKYGVTGQYVSALSIVDGRGHDGIITAGEIQPSLDLVSLVIGSEGTLALVLGAELKLVPRPQCVMTLLVSFETVAHATAFVSTLIARGLVPATLEFMDRATIDAVEAWGVARYPRAAQAVLLIDLDGMPQRVRREADDVNSLARAMDALEIVTAANEAEREALWLGRRGSYAAVGRYGKRIFTQDVTVPRERLTDMLVEIERIGKAFGLMIATVGHAGDGNLHPDFPYDPDNAEMTGRVHAANTEILKACVAIGGSITGEHGIGSDKLHQLPLMYEPVELGVMAEVKQALDPACILNPGKAVPAVPRQPVKRVGSPCPFPTCAEDVQSAILHARKERSSLSIDIQGLTGIRLDPGNLTVDVGAGERWDAVQAALAGTPLTLAITPMREQTVCRTVLFNDYGPEHHYLGTVRQSLLAATYVTGAGEVIHMGRGVVKNVAGYDLFRLLIGSRGRLGVPTSFTFRLVPRRSGVWMKCPWQPDDGPLPYASHYVVLREYEDLIAYAHFTDDIPAQWSETSPIEERIRTMRDTLDSEETILDLAADPRMLSPILAASPQPQVILPTAARLLVTCDPDTGRALTDLASRHGRLPIRSLWGRRRAPLHHLDSLTAQWEHALQTIFDPGNILSHWLDPEENAA